MPEIYEMSDYDPDEVYKKKIPKKPLLKSFMKKMGEIEEGSATLSGYNRENPRNMNPIQDTSRATLSGKQPQAQRTVQRDFNRTIMTDDTDTTGKTFENKDTGQGGLKQ